MNLQVTLHKEDLEEIIKNYFKSQHLNIGKIEYEIGKEEIPNGMDYDQRHGNYETYKTINVLKAIKVQIQNGIEVISTKVTI